MYNCPLALEMMKMSLSSIDIDTSDYELQPSSPLLSLPAELRIQIYSYLLVCPIPSGIRQLHARNHISSYILPALDLHPSILSTCRQAYGEAAPVLYGQNMFAASQTLLTGLPFLLDASRPVVSRSAVERIRRWHLTIRLDVDPRFTDEEAKEAFSGSEELDIDAWQPQYDSVDCRVVLSLFKGIRGVRRATITGSVDPAFARRLEKAMMSKEEDDLEDSASDDALDASQAQQVIHGLGVR